MRCTRPVTLCWEDVVSLVATAMMPDYTGKDISMEYDV
jgi:hypothetical protein